MALTDREIWELGYKYVPNQEYLLNPFRTPTTTDDDDETTPGSGTGTGYITRGHEEEFEGGVPPGVLGSEALLSQFNLATRNRQKRLENPNKITRFFNNLTGGGQRPVSEMVTGNIGDFSRMPIDTKNFGLEVLEDEGQYGPLRTFETDTRRTAGIPMGIAKLFSMLPDPYYDKFTLPQQAYTQLNMGYSGPTVFGQHGSNLSNYDVFGRNVRHGGKRSYNETQQRDIDRLDDYWDSEKFADKYGGAKLEYDAASGSYMFKENGKLTSNAQKANKMNKANLTRYNYDKAGVLKFNTMNKAHEKNLINRKRWEKETRREQDTADDRFGEVIDGIPGGTGDYDEYSGIGGTWSGPVGPQPKDKDYADPSVDAEENQPSNDNIGYNEPTSGSDGEFGPGSWMIADGGMVKDAPRRFFNGGLASVLNRRSFRDGRSAAPDFLTGADRENWLAGYTALPLNEFLIDPFKAPDGGTTPPDGGTTPPDGGGG